MLGPDTPPLGVRQDCGDVTQGQVAATVAERCLELDIAACEQLGLLHGGPKVTRAQTEPAGGTTPSVNRNNVGGTGCCTALTWACLPHAFQWVNMKESTTFSITLACLAAVTAPATAAQTPREPVTTVIRAARMLDVASGQLLRNVSVVVTGDRITAVNPTASPPGAQVVDLGDVTLLPGFIDLHTHLTGEIGPTTFIEPVLETGVDAAFKAARHGRTTVMAGFTTVRDFGGDVTVAMGKAVDRGDVTGPRIVPSRDALGITGGHCDVTGFAPGILEQGPKNGVADGPWAVIEAVRYQIKHGAQVIKTCATAGVLSLEGPVGAQQYTYDELKAMVDEAARHGVRVAAHAHGVEGIKAAVRAGVTSIEHGSVLDDEAIALMKQHGTYLVPTAYLRRRVDLTRGRVSES